MKITYGLVYTLTLTRKNDSAVLNNDNAINNVKNKINSINWCVPHYTPTIAQQAILFNSIQRKTPTELKTQERSIFLKEVKTQSLWNFELGIQEGIKVPI